jgi:hypothetical protein
MRKDDIVIYDMPAKEFKKILTGSQFSLQVQLKQPPFIHQRIIIYAQPEPFSERAPHMFVARVKSYISFDTVLASTMFYDIRWSTR